MTASWARSPGAPRSRRVNHRQAFARRSDRFEENPKMFVISSSRPRPMLGERGPREAAMAAVTITELEPSGRFGRDVAAQVRAVRKEVPEQTAGPLPGQSAASTPSSWERILVGAGLDRESRELGPAERRMLDREVCAL
jgi:hypothetical protein